MNKSTLLGIGAGIAGLAYLLKGRPAAAEEEPEEEEVQEANPFDIKAFNKDGEEIPITILYTEKS